MWGLFEAAKAVHEDQQQHRSIHPGDCSACGSQEFRHWHGRSVCAYCRSVTQATTAPVRHTPVFNEYNAARAADISVRYGLRADIKRHHALARITTD